MRTSSMIALAALAAWLGWAPALAADAQRPSDLVPCAFALSEIAEAIGVELQQADAADMTIPVGRDVGCLYSVKGSDFVFGVRQTWDSTRAAGRAPAGGTAGSRKIVGDPDGAVYTSAAGSGGGGELVYVRGKVRTRVFWHGGNLTDADGLQRLLKLRHVP
jgi:hypothetical protein